MDYKRRPSGLFVPEAKLALKGEYKILHLRDGKIIDEVDVDNIVTNQGIDYILAAGLTGGQAITTWYIGLFTGNYAPVGTDTAATFPGNATECTAYGANRIAFNGSEGGQNANNSASQATFTFTTGATVYGAFMSSAQAVGSVQGILFSAVQFGTQRAVVQNDQLQITYGVTGQSA